MTISGHRATLQDHYARLYSKFTANATILSLPAWQIQNWMI